MKSFLRKGLYWFFINREGIVAAHIIVDMDVIDPKDAEEYKEIL